MSKGMTGRLGRGYANLIGEVQREAMRESAVQTIAVIDIEPGPFQPRKSINRDRLEELAASLRSRGVLQPLLLRAHPGNPGQFQIIAGERRWRAAQLAGLHEVPALVREFSDSDAMAAGLVENLQRQDLDPIEEAEGFVRLIEEFGLTQDELSNAVGKSRPHIANQMRLLSLPDSVQSLVREGLLSAGHARALVGHPEPEVVAQKIVAGKLSVRQTEALAQERKTPKKKRQEGRAEDQAEIRAVERELTTLLGMRVSIDFDGSGGMLRIAYSSLDQFDTLLSLLRPERRGR
jgi:ParB family chromosome partitioning protein